MQPTSRSWFNSSLALAAASLVCWTSHSPVFSGEMHIDLADMMLNIDRAEVLKSIPLPPKTFVPLRLKSHRALLQASAATHFISFSGEVAAHRGAFDTPRSRFISRSRRAANKVKRIAH